MPPHLKVFSSDLHPEIHKAHEELMTYDQFVERLEVVCNPNGKVFKTFDPILHHAYSLMMPYWQALKDEKLTLKERKKKSLELLARLEENPKIEDFYKEFSACINVDNLLKS